MLTPYWSALAETCAGVTPSIDLALVRHRSSAPEAHAGSAFDVLRSLATARPAELRDWLARAPAETPVDLALHGIGALAAGLLSDAMASLGQASLMLKDHADPWLRLHVESEYARCCARLGDLTRAARSGHAAMMLAQGVGDRRMEGLQLGNLGYLYGERDEPVSYEAYSRRALAIFREIGDLQLTAHALCNLGGALARMGRLEEAAAAYAEGWPLAQGLDWPRGHALFLAGTGGLKVAQGRFSDGEADYLASIRILQQIGDPYQEGRHWFVLGRHFVEEGQHARAIPVLRRAIELSEAHGHASTRAQSLAHLSTALEAEGDLAGALAALRAHLASRTETADERVEARVRAGELAFAAERARADAAHARARSAELERHNRELSEAQAALRAPRAGTRDA